MMREIKQTKAFEKKHKKLKKPDKETVNGIIKNVVKYPEKGDPKKGDLSGYFTASYKIHGGQCRLLYCYNDDSLTLVDIGPSTP